MWRSEIQYFVTIIVFLLWACPCHFLILNVWSNGSTLGCHTLTCSETSVSCTITQSSPDEGQTLQKSYQCLNAEGEVTGLEEEEETDNDDGYFANIKVEARMTKSGPNEDPEKVFLVNDGTLLICEDLTCVKPAKSCHVIIETTQESAEKVERITRCLAEDGVVIEERRMEVKNTYSSSGFYIRIENVLVAPDKRALTKKVADKKTVAKKTTDKDPAKSKTLDEPPKLDESNVIEKDQADANQQVQSSTKPDNEKVIYEPPIENDEANNSQLVQSMEKPADKSQVDDKENNNEPAQNTEAPKANSNIKEQVESLEKPPEQPSKVVIDGNKFMCGKLECPETAIYCVITKKTQPRNMEHVENLMECLNDKRKMVRDLREIMPNPDPSMSVEEKSEKKRPAMKPKPFQCGPITCSDDTDQCVIAHHSIAGFWEKMDTSIQCLSKSGKILQHLTKREDSPNNETFINTCVRIYRSGRVSHMNASFSSGDGIVNNLPLALSSVPKPLCASPPPPPAQPPPLMKFPSLSETVPVRYSPSPSSYMQSPPQHPVPFMFLPAHPIPSNYMHSSQQTPDASILLHAPPHPSNYMHSPQQHSVATVHDSAPGHSSCCRHSPQLAKVSSVLPPAPPLPSNYMHFPLQPSVSPVFPYAPKSNCMQSSPQSPISSILSEQSSLTGKGSPSSSNCMHSPPHLPIFEGSMSQSNPETTKLAIEQKLKQAFTYAQDPLVPV